MRRDRAGMRLFQLKLFTALTALHSLSYQYLTPHHTTHHTTHHTSHYTTRENMSNK